MRVDFHPEARAGLTERGAPSALQGLLLVYFSSQLWWDELHHAQKLSYWN